MARPAPAQTVIDKPSATAAAPVKTLEALSSRPYQCHGSIGPSCAVAQWQGGRLTVWTHSQGVFPLRGDLAKAFGVGAKDIRCIPAEGPGCYVHNGPEAVPPGAGPPARAPGARP